MGQKDDGLLRSFFFQAEDGIRDYKVTGVQTCALPICTIAPAEERPDRYVYDPSDAAPTIGGPLCCGALPTGIGPEDQRPAEARGDVLVYTTPAFAKDTEVTGPVSLDLYASSSAVDTDFTGMLVDVWPNGFAHNLTSGILRLRYRNSQEKPELANPGETYHITVRSEERRVGKECRSR